MSEFVHVAVDAMGGDNAPSEIVKGAVNALNKCPNLKVTLTGKEEIVKAELEKLTFPADRVEILNCTEVIAMAEPPVDEGSAPCQGRGVRRVCNCRKYGSGSRRRPTSCGQDQGDRETPAGSADADG